MSELGYERSRISSEARRLDYQTGTERELAAIRAARPHQRLRRRHGGDRANRRAADWRRGISRRFDNAYRLLHRQLRVVKAFANLVSGHFADVWGRKHVLVL